jgi:hypothetical protein
MAMAAYAPTGDAGRSGKPYAFYLLNYAVVHLVPTWTGGVRPVSLHLFYAALSVCSIAWLARRATDTVGEFSWYFAALLCAPFFVFNSTQVMMETAVLPLLTLTLAEVINLERHGSSLGSSLSVFGAAALALLFKETAAAALLILLAAFWPRLGRRVWPLAAALVAGVAIALLMRAAVHAPSYVYGGVSGLLDVGAWRSRMGLAGQYASMWLFFVWPFTALAVFVLFVRGRLNGAHERTLMRLAVLSLFATFGVEMISNFALARYAYPAVWLGVVAFAFLLMRGPRWLAALSIVLGLVPIADMWRADPSRFSLWPPLVANEAHYSSYGLFPGAPNLGWLAFAGDRRVNACVFIPRDRAEGPEWIQRYFESVTVAPRFFDESRVADFERCDGPKITARRQYQDPPQCGPECPATSIFSAGACSLTEDRFEAPGRILTNLTCLP